MTKAGRLAVMVALAIATAGIALADNADLKRARDLYDQREFGAAQAALQTVKRDQLTGADVAEFDRLSNLLQEATSGMARASNDLADANRALAEGRPDDADRQFLAVSTNRFASESQLAAARAGRQRILEMRSAAAAGGAQQSAPASPPPPPPPTGWDPTMGGPASPPPSQFEPASPTRLTLVDQLRQRDDLLWQRAVAQLDETDRLAHEALAAGRLDDARQLADQAVQVVDAARMYAQPPSKYEAAKARATSLRQEILDSIDKANIDKAGQQREMIARQIEARRAAQERLRAEKVEQLFNTADQLRKERRYVEAAEAIRQVRIIDPSNARAALLLDVYEDLASYASQGEMQRTIGVQQRGALEDAESALIPWYQDVLYPKNWVEITARRKGIERGFGGRGEDGELNRVLDRERGISEMSFQDTPLSQVVEFMQDLTKVNMNVDWDDLTSNGVERDKPVTLRLRDVTFRTALRELLGQVGGEVRLAYAVGDGLIRIATKDKLDRDKFILTYDIRDLLVNVRNFRSPSLDLTQSSPAPGGSPGWVSGAGNASQSVFRTGVPATERDDEMADQNTNLRMVQRIMDIIRTTVEPDSWRENGGSSGALRELNGQLIVYNTSDAQRQVSNLLEQLRATRALQISVEGRFLTVTSNFLEEIGVDLDFVFNSANAGYDPAFNNQGVALFDPFTGAPILIPRAFSRSGVLPAQPNFGVPIQPQLVPAQPYGNAAFVPAPGGPGWSSFTPIPMQQGSIGLTDPSQINTGIPGTFGSRTFAPALSIAGAFLDNLQIDFLIRATQADRRSSVVAAPRLVMFNGQAAFVAFTTSQSYVASLNPQVAEAAVAVQPVVAQANSGTVLNVEGTISADRRYVTLTVDFALSEPPTFERFQIQQGSGPSPGLFIQLPTQSTQQVRTTVSVPDGGTVLLGGLKQVGEVEIEAGVPMLSKVPVLNRAFTNRSMVKDTRTLLILLKSKIIIQREAENEVFPGLDAAGG